MAEAYGIIGFPVAQSFSPAFFREKFAREAIEATYTAFALEQIAALPPLLAAHPELRGLNVTIPHKQTVIAYLEDMDPAAEAIGAVNCIAIRNGRLKGYNTDATGFKQSLEPLLQPHHTRALVLGSGGASKAVCYVLKKLGMDHRTVTRTPGPGTLMYDDISKTLLEQFPVIINTTPLGMYPDAHGLPELPYQHLTPGHLLYDLVYNPEETKFLMLGRQQGAVTKNGLEMLHLQAEAAWKIWNP
jgi:shikimate dehydrogenase